MNKPETQWPDLLECYYGVFLNDHQAMVWFGEMINANNADLCCAIRLAADEGLKPVEYRATVRDLIRWLKKYRAIKHSEADAGKKAVTIAGITARLAAKHKSGVSIAEITEALESELKAYPWITIKEANEIFRQSTTN